MNIIIKHNKEKHQFFSIIEEKIATLDYAILPDGKTLNYLSTYVPPELRGQQIGQMIVKFALEYAKTNKYKVIPSCSFVDSYIRRHPEYNDLLAREIEFK